MVMGATNVTSIFLPNYPFCLFPSTSTSIFAGPVGLMHSFFLLECNCFTMLLVSAEAWALSHHIFLGGRALHLYIRYQNMTKQSQETQLQHLNFIFCPHWVTIDPLYTPDNQIQLILTKWWFFFLPLFSPLTPLLNQAPSDYLLRHECWIWPSAPREIMPITSLIWTRVSPPGLCPDLLLVAKRGTGERCWGCGIYYKGSHSIIFKKRTTSPKQGVSLFSSSEGSGEFMCSKFIGPIKTDVPTPYIKVKFFPNQGLSLSRANLIRLRIKPFLKLWYSYG